MVKDKHTIKLIMCTVRLARHGLIGCKHGVGYGNASIRINENNFVITPSGVGCNILPGHVIADADMVEVTTMEFGLMHSSKQKPSSDCRLHSTVYKKLGYVHGIVHFHSDVVAPKLPALPFAIDDSKLTDYIAWEYDIIGGPYAFSLQLHSGGCIVIAETLEQATDFAIGLKGTFSHRREAFERVG